MDAIIRLPGYPVTPLPGFSVIWLFGEDKRDFLLIAAILRHLQRYSTAGMIATSEKHLRQDAGMKNKAES